ncbi:MAG: CPBP family intramembrane metalloprotease [Ruminococcaceae bacterium]|nr:CPBP family intramembrane metalloprotease [Oscillospiraceae bacterium]
MKNKASIYTPILLIVVYLFLAAIRFVPGDVLGMDENPYLAVVILQLLIYVVPALFYCSARGRGTSERMRLRLPRPGHILLLVYAAVFLVCGNALISMGMYQLMPRHFSEASSFSGASFAMNRGVFDGMYMVVAFAILPALTEELIFRGIVVGEYEHYGPGFAIVLSALTFAMSHFNFARLPVYLFSGLVLALVLYATRSLAASVIIHSLNNVSVLLLEKYVLHIARKQNISMLLLVIILVTAAVVSLTLFCGEAAGIYRGYAEEALPVEYGRGKGRSLFERLAETCFSPTFLILAVIFITITVTQ